MESDLSVASEVTQARVTEALKVGAETATCQREPGGRYSHNTICITIPFSRVTNQR
jgi:hypothetical protein